MYPQIKQIKGGRWLCSFGACEYTWLHKFRGGETLMPLYPDTNDGGVIATSRTQEEQPSSGQALLQALRELGLIGLWADREDIGETVEYARKLRDAASLRITT